jgi:transcriptional regulator with XRE-family HTH domain
VRVTTQEQREAFRQALIHIRQQRGWSQRRLAKEVGLSHSTIAVWERGQTIPEPANVVELERALELESGTLARLVGYMPAGTMRQEMISVLDAIMADPDLGERERALLLTMYRQLVQQSRADRAEREAGQTAAGGASNQGQDRR